MQAVFGGIVVEGYGGMGERLSEMETDPSSDPSLVKGKQ